LYDKIKKCIITASLQFQKLNISLEEFYSEKLISSKPLERPEAAYFFQCIKFDKIEEVMRLLNNNKFLVYEFDNVIVIIISLNKQVYIGLLKEINQN